MRFAFLFISLSLLSFSNIFGQLTGSTINEYQYGKLPTDTAGNFSTLYSRLNLSYNYKSFKLFLNTQAYITPYGSRNYIDASQYGANYRTKNFEINLGHFYQTFGRGVLLRTYEIPGSLLEDKGFRVRQSFYRDIFGFSGSYKIDKLTLKILHGKTLNNLYPPTEKEELRRTDLVSGASIGYQIGNQIISTDWIRLKNSVIKNIYGSVNLSGVIGKGLSYYSEIARKVSDNNINDFSDTSSFALYTGFNFVHESFGISAEIKKYRNFLLGAGINEPPALVREHTYKVLNRSTHVLEPLNEQGFQVEAFYDFGNNTLITLNHTLAQNRFNKLFSFREYFAEIAFPFYRIDSKVFFDYADDPFKLESNRISTGISSEFHITDNQSLKIDLEFQQFDRQNDMVRNAAYGLTYLLNSYLSVNLSTETSTDPFLTESKRWWNGTNIQYKRNSYAIQLFAGKRRGGPACTSGICYEQLDFEGLEFRFNYRF